MSRTETCSLHLVSAVTRVDPCSSIGSHPSARCTIIQMKPVLLFSPFLKKEICPYRKGYSIIQEPLQSPWDDHRFTFALGMTMDDESQVMDSIDPSSIFGLLAFSILIGVTAQTFINSMIQGEQGLGAFLSDGDGFSNSKFKPVSRKATKTDPLPWLKLPKLDFVEVVGQEEEKQVLGDDDRLQLMQNLMQRMEKELQSGDTAAATRTKYYIDSLLSE